jgi:hypothetical protein
MSTGCSGGVVACLCVGFLVPAAAAVIVACSENILLASSVRDERHLC